MVRGSESEVYWMFFKDTATTKIYTLSLHDALPIPPPPPAGTDRARPRPSAVPGAARPRPPHPARRPARRSRAGRPRSRSEEHTSELQSRQYLVCRLLLEKKNLRPPCCPPPLPLLPT